MPPYSYVASGVNHQMMLSLETFVLRQVRQATTGYYRLLQLTQYGLHGWVMAWWLEYVIGQ
jgi:hypothetical protein